MFAKAPDIPLVKPLAIDPTELAANIIATGNIINTTATAKITVTKSMRVASLSSLLICS
jgi:hypothetical protein